MPSCSTNIEFRIMIKEVNELFCLVIISYNNDAITSILIDWTSFTGLYRMIFERTYKI